MAEVTKRKPPAAGCASAEVARRADEIIRKGGGEIDLGSACLRVLQDDSDLAERLRLETQRVAR